MNDKIDFLNAPLIHLLNRKYGLCQLVAPLSLKSANLCKSKKSYRFLALTSAGRKSLVKDTLELFVSDNSFKTARRISRFHHE